MCSSDLFVFLVLAAQYESLTLPLAVIMIVPMCLVAALTGVILRGQDNNILTQVGFVVLIGLAAKNAILIVEFARQLEDQGRTRWDAAVEATRLRLRPILMTSFAFVLAVVFVFLVLAAQYESLTLPLAVIMIVPMCLVAAITGVILRGQDNNILTQVGFVVLIGLAAKNAILIVEFARQLEDQGRSRWDAAVEATRLRLRPILMTSFAFILGVTPLVWAIGAGAELRQTLGTAVFAGMIGVTAFGLVFTPVFYVIARWIAELGLWGKWQRTRAQPAE